MEAHHDSAFKNILNSAGMVVPDGMPLVWLGRLKGYALKRQGLRASSFWHSVRAVCATAFAFLLPGLPGLWTN